LDFSGKNGTLAVCLGVDFVLGLSVLNFWGEEEDIQGRPAERGMPAALCFLPLAAWPSTSSLQ